jgi:hypothetical protein
MRTLPKEAFDTIDAYKIKEFIFPRLAFTEEAISGGTGIGNGKRRSVQEQARPLGAWPSS